MKPTQGTLGILRHKADNNYCEQPVGISCKIGQGTASFYSYKSLQADLFGDAGGCGREAARAREVWGEI